MKQRVMTVLVCALLSVALVPAPSSAQTPVAASGSITGRVEGSSGAPLAGVQVLAYTETDTWVGTGTVTGADGSYQLGGLGPGPYRVLFHGQELGFVSEWFDDSPSRAAARELTVPAGGALDGVDATLTPGGTVSGTVNQLGEPIGGVTVWAHRDGDRWVGTAATSTAADGTYQLRGLPSGEYRLLFAAPAGSGLASEWWDDQTLRSSAATVSVTPSAAVTGIDSQLGLPVPPGEPPLRYRDPIFPGVVTTSAVPYADVTTRRGEDVTLLADVYQPEGDTEDSRPAMLLVFGGSFRFGSRTSPELVDQARYLAARGYVVVSIDYRLSPTGCGFDAECLLAIADARADSQTAVRWLRHNAATYGVDPDRIAIGGTSAGAITALNVGYHGDDPSPGPLPDVSSRVQAVVSLSGAALPWGADPGDAPALLFHNEVDPLVSYSWARNTVDAARAAGVTAHLVTFEGTGHVPYVAHRDEILETTMRFLYATLDLGALPRGAADVPSAGAPMEELVGS